MKKPYLFLLLLLGLHLFFLFNLRFTVWPETVSFPYLINHGFLLYKDAIHAYPPLLVSVLAVLNNLFGYSPWVLKFFGWSLLLTNDVLIFLIAKKITKKNNLAFFSLFFYILIQPFLEGNMVWPDIVMITPLLFGFLFLQRKKYFGMGFSLALAVLVKQTGFLYLLLIGFHLILMKEKLVSTRYFIMGICVIFIPFLAWLVYKNIFMDFLNWTVVYPSVYWTRFPGYVQMILTKREFVVIALLILPLILGIRYLKHKKILLFLIAMGFIGVYPRFSFFHFQPALAFLAIVYAYLVNKSGKALAVLVLSYLFIFAFTFLPSLSSNWRQETRFWGKSDFELGQLIKENTKEGDKIFLLGLQSGLYVFADRLPSKPWIDTFGWYYEIPGIQEGVIESWKINPPRDIYWKTPDSGNWYDLGSYQPKKITSWVILNYNKEKEVVFGVWLWRKK